ncbi:MAG: VOC family protein [Syntrophobacteraceae bacterium]
MAVKPIPEGYHTVTPLLSVKGAARLIDFMKKAFEATETYRVPSPDGSVMHAELKIGNSVIMLGEPMEGSFTRPATFYVYVQDADATYRAALEAGGESLEGPTDRFWGDRVASIKDFAGNNWMIATHVEDVDAGELTRRAQQAMAA